MLQALSKTVCWFLTKQNPPYNPAIPLLRVYPDGLKTYVHPKVLFTIAKN